MESNEDRGYGMCTFCGAPNVKNPKTDKVFCSKMCWKNKGKREDDKQELSARAEERLANIEKSLERLIITFEYFNPPLKDWVDEKIWKKYGIEETSYEKLTEEKE